MKRASPRPNRAFHLCALAALGLLMSLLGGATGIADPASPTQSYIVQATSTQAAAKAVEAAGGSVSHELGIIHAVAAGLTAEQLSTLRGLPSVRRIYGDHTAELTAKGGNGGNGGNGQVIETFYPTHLGADLLHQEGIDGSGVTIAVLDSGIFGDNGLDKNTQGVDRLLAYYDSVLDHLEPGSSVGDEYGHGSHVASVAVSSRQTESGTFNGMAPAADLVVVRAFDINGMTWTPFVRN